MKNIFFWVSLFIIFPQSMAMFYWPEQKEEEESEEDGLHFFEEDAFYTNLLEIDTRKFIHPSNFFMSTKGSGFQTLITSEPPLFVFAAYNKAQHTGALFYVTEKSIKEDSEKLFLDFAKAVVNAWKGDAPNFIIISSNRAFIDLFKYIFETKRFYYPYSFYHPNNRDTGVGLDLDTGSIFYINAKTPQISVLKNKPPLALSRHQTHPRFASIPDISAQIKKLAQ